MPSEFINNENRKRLADSINRPTDRLADGSIAGGARIDPNSVHGNDLPPGILNGNSIPMTKDAHQNARHSNENRNVAPGEGGSRSRYTDDIHRRLHGRDVKYR